MALWAVGALINLIGSVMINLGTNIIKLGHNKAAEAAGSGAGKPPKLTQALRAWWHFPGSRVWLGGMALFGAGNLLNFASFAFAAQSLLSALSVVQFISNIAFGRYVNKERVTRRVVFATAVVCTGCVLLVAFGNHESPTLSTQDMLALYSAPLYIAYLCLIFTLSPAMYLTYRAGKRAVLADRGGRAARRWARWLPVTYALFAGLLGTQSVLYGKTLAMLLRTTLSGDSQLGQWYFWLSALLFLLAASYWMSRYSKAMKLFPVLIIMPLLQIVWVLFSIISGSLFFQEYKSLTALSGSMFGLGVAVLLAGVWLLTGGSAAQPSAGAKLEPGGVEEEEGEEGKASEAGDAALCGAARPSDSGPLAPEEQLVARRLSSVYDERGAGASPPLRVSPARPSPGRRAAGAGAGESAQQLVEAGGVDSAAWPAPSDASEAATCVAISEDGDGGAARAASDATLSRSRRGAAGAASGLSLSPRAASAPGQPGTPPPRSLLHDLRSDWGVGPRELGAAVRASVGWAGQADPDLASFSLWSMPMPPAAAAASTAAGRGSLDARRPTARLRAALEAAAPLAGGGRGGSAHGGGLWGGGGGGRQAARPGHRRLNRSRSANELDDMLRQMEEQAQAQAQALPQQQPLPQQLEELELGERAVSSGGLDSPWRAASSMSLAGAASGWGVPPAAAPFSTPPPPPPRLHAAAGSGAVPAPAAITPPAGAGPAALSSEGSGPRRPWSPEGGPASPLPPQSPLSEVGENEVLPALAAAQEAAKGDKAA